jgi:hypothetical protein
VREILVVNARLFFLPDESGRCWAPGETQRGWAQALLAAQRLADGERSGDAGKVWKRARRDGVTQRFAYRWHIV